MKTRRMIGLCMAVLLVTGQGAGATSETCREWWGEHDEWKARVVRLYLSDASPRELDAAVFELVQREAYLTVCATPVPAQRSRMIAWRTLDRPVDEYGTAVVESVLDQAGFDLSLDSVFRPVESARRPGRMRTSRSSAAREAR